MNAQLILVSMDDAKTESISSFVTANPVTVESDVKLRSTSADRTLVSTVDYAVTS